MGVASIPYGLPAQAAVVSPTEFKSCCAALYESDWAHLLLGESLHPGGLALTERLGVALGLGPDKKVLDAACGAGASAVFLAERFGCRVVGVDFSPRLIAAARARAADRSVSAQVDFLPGDVETLHMDNGSFDAIICECAFCTFPDKAAAARGFNRVLKPGGGIGVSDLTRTGALDVRLNTLLAWVACVADARPAADYAAILTAAGLVVDATERHDEVLDTIAEDVHLKLMGAEILQKLGRATLPPGLELEEVKALARSASAAIRAGNLGYAVILAHKPQSDLG